MKRRNAPGAAVPAGGDVAAGRADLTIARPGSASPGDAILFAELAGSDPAPLRNGPPNILAMTHQSYQRLDAMGQATFILAASPTGTRRSWRPPEPWAVGWSCPRI